MAHVIITGKTARDLSITVDGSRMRHVTQLCIDADASRPGGPVFVVLELQATTLEVDLPDAVLEALKRRHPNAGTSAGTPLLTSDGKPVSLHTIGVARDEPTGMQSFAAAYAALPQVVRHTLLRYLRLATWDECEAAADDPAIALELDRRVVERAMSASALGKLKAAVATATRAVDGDPVAEQALDVIEHGLRITSGYPVNTWHEAVNAARSQDADATGAAAEHAQP